MCNPLVSGPMFQPLNQSSQGRCGLLLSYSPLFSSSPGVPLLSRKMMPDSDSADLLSTFCVPDHRLPSPVAMEVSEWVSCAPGPRPARVAMQGLQAQGSRTRWFSQGKWRSGFLCETSQFSKLARPFTFFRLSASQRKHVFLPSFACCDPRAG